MFPKTKDEMLNRISQYRDGLLSDEEIGNFVAMFAVDAPREEILAFLTCINVGQSS